MSHSSPGLFKTCQVSHPSSMASEQEIIPFLINYCRAPSIMYFHRSGKCRWIYEIYVSYQPYHISLQGLDSSFEGLYTPSHNKSPQISPIISTSSNWWGTYQSFIPFVPVFIYIDAWRKLSRSGRTYTNFNKYLKVSGLLISEMIPISIASFFYLQLDGISMMRIWLGCHFKRHYPLNGILISFFGENEGGNLNETPFEQITVKTYVGLVKVPDGTLFYRKTS